MIDVITSKDLKIENYKEIFENMEEGDIRSMIVKAASDKYLRDEELKKDYRKFLFTYSEEAKKLIVEKYIENYDRLQRIKKDKLEKERERPLGRFTSEQTAAILAESMKGCPEIRVEQERIEKNRDRELAEVKERAQKHMDELDEMVKNSYKKFEEIDKKELEEFEKRNAHLLTDFDSGPITQEDIDNYPYAVSEETKKKQKEKIMRKHLIENSPNIIKMMGDHLEELKVKGEKDEELEELYNEIIKIRDEK